MKYLILLVLIGCGKGDKGLTGPAGPKGDDACLVTTESLARDGKIGTVILCDGEEIVFIQPTRKKHRHHRRRHE